MLHQRQTRCRKFRRHFVNELTKFRSTSLSKQISKQVINYQLTTMGLHANLALKSP